MSLYFCAIILISLMLSSHTLADLYSSPQTSSQSPQYRVTLYKIKPYTLCQGSKLSEKILDIWASMSYKTKDLFPKSTLFDLIFLFYLT